MSDRTNAGYTIINAVTVGKGEIVLGERTTANGQRVADKAEMYRSFDKDSQRHNRERDER